MRNEKLDAILNEELTKYSSASGLSKRETEILGVMLRGVTSSEAVSHQLGISPNTTNNHVKSILDKTNSSSKTELLSRFLENLMKNYTDFRLYSRKPRILIVDDEAEIGELVAENLNDRGLKAFHETDPNSTIERIAQLHVDFLIVDIKMPGMDGFQVLKEVRKKFQQFPIVFMMTGFSEYTEVECLNEGAAAFFPKPVDLNSMFYSIIEHYMELEYENFAIGQGSESIRIKKPRVPMSVGNVGFGGAFVAIDDEAAWRKSDLHVGDYIEFESSYHTSGDPVRFSGLIVWERRHGEADKPAGFGLRFKGMPPDTVDEIHDYIRGQGVHSFIPSGPVR